MNNFLALSVKFWQNYAILKTSLIFFSTFRSTWNFWMVNDGLWNFIYKFLMKKYLTHIFSCLSYAPFWSYVPLKTKFENLVCKISQKVLELESSYLVYWLMLRSSPGKLLRTSAKFRQNYSFFDFLLHFYIVCKKLTFCFWSEQLLQEIKFRFIHMK